MPSLQRLIHGAGFAVQRTRARPLIYGVVAISILMVVALMSSKQPGGRNTLAQPDVDGKDTQGLLSNLLDQLQDYYQDAKENIRDKFGLKLDLRGGAGSGSYQPDHEVMLYEEIQRKLRFDMPPPGKRRKNVIKDNMEFYHGVLNTKIKEPLGKQLVRAPGPEHKYQLANATLLVLARNQELEGIVSTIEAIERTFNSKFHYPYTLVNNEDFSDAFKERVQAVASGKLEFVKLDALEWDTPPSIDQLRLPGIFDMLEEQHVNYADMMLYRHMCRFNSVTFYKLKALSKYRWYWRFEPDTNYYCEIDYDVFKFMEDNGKTYGFTIALYDLPQTIKSLWPTTLKFLKLHPEYVHPNGAFKFLTNSFQNPWHVEFTGGYSGCHFWLNFEIGDMDFYRLEPYSMWAEALEEAGGFYYERWGDAPVHLVGLGLFEDKSKIHWFRDIGYHHRPYTNCPNSDKCGGCTVAEFGPELLETENCMAQWIQMEMSDAELKGY